MGVCIGADTVLTSAHVVRDDTISYQLRVINYESIGMTATLSERDHSSDIAYMRVKSEE
jgi:S1-C subfamily serine protease